MTKHFLVIINSQSLLQYTSTYLFCFKKSVRCTDRNPGRAYWLTFVCKVCVNDCTYLAITLASNCSYSAPINQVWFQILTSFFCAVLALGTTRVVDPRIGSDFFLTAVGSWSGFFLKGRIQILIYLINITIKLKGI